MKKHWIGLAALVLLILVLFFIFFPQILSSTYGKRILIRSIETKTHSHVTVKSLHLSWFGPQRLTQLTMKDAEYEGTIESLQVGVPLTSLSTLFKLEHFEAINGDLKLENGLFQFHKEGSSSCTINDLQGTVLLHKGIADVTVSATSLQEGQKGSLSFRAQLKNLKTLFTDTSLHAELVSFPTLPLAYTLKRQELADDHLVLQTLGPLVGTVVGLTLENKKGTLDFALHASNADLDLQANLAQDVITLRQALTATVRLTPELSQRLMRKANPLFLTGVQAKNPIQLRIESRNFRFFLGPFKLEHVQIGQGTLIMGQIRCSNGSSLASLISLLKSDFLTKTKEMNVWFTPLSFRLVDGVLQTNRMDALIAETVHICTWGTIDLNQDRVNMMLGICADTLNSSFGIKRVPADYVLKIPLTGSTNDPKLSTGVAAAKIAALLATQKAPGGGFAGGILNLFVQPEADIPPPNRPFPWEH